MQQGFNPKELHFSDEGRNKLIQGIKQIANAVKSTLGPRGNTVLIESPEHLHGITVTKDGVTVAKSISLLDPVENLAVRMMKEAADRTASSAGDGTTTAIVLAEALVNAGTELITDKVNRTEVLRHLVDITKLISKDLKVKGKKLDAKRLRDVAVISANNDKTIGDIIADVYESVGKDGVVTVENSKTSATYYETTKGIKIKRGYSSGLFINDQKRDECVLEDTYVLVCDGEINNILQIENILKPIIQEGKKLLIIAPCSTNVINTLAANVVKNGLKICNIVPPDFGYRQHELMQDIAISVGATYFSEKTGDDLSLIKFNDLGHCSKVIVGRDSTVIDKDDKETNQEVVDRVTQLQEAFEDRKSQGFVWNNIMLSKWVDHEGVEHRVKEDYDRNRELIDLSRQPDHIKEIISSTIKSATSTPKNSTQVGVYLMKFCHLFDLQKIKDLAGQYAAPLNGRYGT